MKKQGGWFSMAMVMVFLACFAGYFSTRLMMGPKDAMETGDGKIDTLQAAQAQEETGELAKETKAANAANAGNENVSGIVPAPQVMPMPDSAPDPAAVNAPPLATLGTVIQFGRFTTREGGTLVADQLKAQGIYSMISKEEAYYIIISGKYPDKESAKGDVWKYKAMGIDCFVTEKQV